MEPWLEGILTVAGLLAAVVMAGASALCLARSLGIHHRLKAEPAIEPVQTTVSRLAALADLARAQGLLAAESRVDGGTEPILAMGLTLAVEGIDPNELRSRLDRAVEDAAGGHRSLGVPWSSAVTALGAAIVFALIVVNASDPESTTATIAGIGVCSFFALITLVSMIPLRDPAAASAGVLAGMLQSTTAVMIRTGRDGTAVRLKLQGMLPAAPAAAARSKAA